MITQELVTRLFKYEKGILYWINSPSRNVKPGDPAGCKMPNGYTCVSIANKNYYSHRIIFLYHHGYLPEFLDHKYGINIGDYLWNLRECTQRQNCCNQKLTEANTSGVKGVYWNKTNKKWMAKIRSNKKIHRLGCFDNIKDAEIAVRKLREELHGEFCNHGER